MPRSQSRGFELVGANDQRSRALSTLSQGPRSSRSSIRWALRSVGKTPASPDTVNVLPETRSASRRWRPQAASDRW